MKNILTLLIFTLPFLLNAQSIERQVVASGGSFTSTANLQVSSTVGEVITATSSSANIILTQGFQQTSKEDESVSIKETTLGLTINAFPNPTSEVVNLEIDAQKPLVLELEMVDMLGKKHQLSNSKLNISGRHAETINLSTFADGTYFLRLNEENGDFSETIKILKVRK